MHVIHSNSILCNVQTAAVVRGGNVPWQQATVGWWCFKVGAGGLRFTRDAQAVMLPANQAIQLVTSGAFGLLYYREASSSGPGFYADVLFQAGCYAVWPFQVPNLRSAICWCLLALWTLGFILLLSQEGDRGHLPSG